MLADKEVNHPTYQMGELEPLEERVQKTVSQFLYQCVSQFLYQFTNKTCFYTSSLPIVKCKQ